MFRHGFYVKWGLVLWRVYVFRLWPLAHCFIKGQQLTWAVFWEGKRMIRMQKTTDCLWICDNLSMFSTLWIRCCLAWMKKSIPWETFASFSGHLEELRICTEALRSSEIDLKGSRKRECWNMFNANSGMFFFVSSAVVVSWQLSLCKLTSWHLKEKWQGHRRDESWVHLC